MHNHRNSRYPISVSRINGCERHLASVHFLVFHTRCYALLFLPSLSMEILLAKISGNLSKDLWGFF